MTKREKLLTGVTAAALAAAAVPWIAPHAWRTAAPSEASAAARGREVAERLGCVSCHGPGGTGGVPDPGSAEPVPAFTGGVPWEYADDRREIANWILYGDPRGRGEIERQHGKERHTKRSPAGTADGPLPAAQVETADAHAEHQGLLRMPAFEGRLTETELADVIAWIEALSPPDRPADESVRRGLAVANANACFACHGPMGTGGISNPGSFKGYIPGFFGKDLDELARTDDELEAWIREGNVVRLARNPAAKVFLDRQAIKMPGYGNRLTDDEVRDLVAMIRWIRKDG